MENTRRQFIEGVGASVLGVTTVSTVVNPEVVDTSTSSSEDIEIVGHRGFSSQYRDNSLAGFKAANEVGSDGVEIDIRKTQDGKLVLKHDWFVLDLERGYKINDVTYEQLQSLEHIITAREAIKFLSTTDLDLYIGMKESIATEVMSLLTEFDVIDNTIFLSFDSEILNIVPDKYPTFLVGTVPTEFMIRNAHKNSFSGVLPHYSSPSSLRDFFEVAQSYNLTCGYWAISSSHYDISMGIDSNPDIIITNDPEFAIKESKR